MTERIDVQTAERNLTVLERISDYLTRHPRLITPEDVQEIAAVGIEREEAMRLLFESACGVNKQESAEDRLLSREYFQPSLRRLDAKAFAENPYLRAIRFPKARAGRWEMTTLFYAPCELFVRDDLLILPDGREIPQIGYFEETVAYPAVLEDGREWMTVTPNEIATMQAAIDAAQGNVVAMGLGLGYFAFMASEKAEVTSVTVIEREESVIRLFERFLLPQFLHREKIRIVRADAIDYARETLPGTPADFVFVDLWHDTLDGAPMYLRMKQMEPLSPGKRFAYWIEPSIRSFLRGIESDGFD